MGSWGLGPFDDDTALDFVDALRDLPLSTIQSVLERALRTVASEDGYVEYASAVEAVACAALLAGQCDDDLVRAWLSTVPLDVTRESAELALRAIDRVHSTGSHLWELRADAGLVRESRAAVSVTIGVLRRLSGFAREEMLF